MNSQDICVLYDGLGLAEPYGGVSRYFCEIIKNLPSNCKAKLALAETCNKSLQMPPFMVPSAKMSAQMFLPSLDFKGKYRLYDFISSTPPWRRRTEEYNNKLKLKAALQKGDFDILHITAPHFVGSAWRQIAGRKPFVLTIHDLIPEIIYGNKRLMSQRKDVLAAAAHIIAVSENTKKDIIRVYNVSDDKITVVYHGALGSCEGEGYAHNIKERYLLYVGRREGYKNYEFFIASVAELLQKEDISVICAGKEFNFKEKRLHRQLNVERRVRALACSDAELKKLYAKALCLVYPSLYEGFGLPIIEAFAAKCPVITAKGGSLNEVAGSAAVYFEYGKPETLLKQVQCVIRDESIRNKIIKAGCDRVKLFDWGKSAKETYNVYKKIVMGV